MVRCPASQFPIGFTAVVPANAGTHNPWPSLLQEASTTRLKRESAPYGSRLGGRDDGQIVRIHQTTILFTNALPHSRDDIRPSFANSFAPKKKRAQGRPGARCTRGLVCKQTSKNAHEHTGSAETLRPSLRNGLRLIPCSPRRDQSLFVTVANVIRSIIADLTPAIGASGPHDFAVRFSRARQSQPSRPPHPTARFVTCATPLLPGGMAHEATDLGKKQSGIFSTRILDQALVYSARRTT